MKTKVGIIIQARLGSKRLPKKILKKINNQTIIEFLLKRLKSISFEHEIIIATTTKKEDKEILKIAKKNKVSHFCGNENDVLDRYYNCAKNFNLDIIIRITSDCPFSDSILINRMYDKFCSIDVDYLSNVINPTFPDGLDVEIFKFKLLENTWLLAKNRSEREHVTKYMINNPNIKKYNFKNEYDMSSERLTLDTSKDFKKIKDFYFLLNNPEVDNYLLINKKLKEIKNMNKLTKNNTLWDKAKKIILNGNMLLSKNPEIILPNKWPTYFSKTKRTNVWDIQNIKYSDCFMLVGSNLLGYNYKKIQNEITKVVLKGNISSLNCPEEVELSEKLINIHPWSSFTKFAKTGGEINLIALRIARSNTKKKNIAFCGYHGWHDWYLSANLTNKKNLNDHLFENISTVGIPENLKNTAYQFNYKDLEGLKKLIEKKNVGVVIMEFARIKDLNITFLKNVRKLCKKYGCILIYDECTSGFREFIGGIHMKYGINPDIATFGKALGNGYPITALVAKEKLKKNAEKAFISSTNWTDRLGYVAANCTIDVMRKIRSDKIITNLHKDFCKNIKKIAKKNKLKIKIEGLIGIPVLNFIGRDNEIIKNFITQEMLKEKILASTSIYLSIFHNKIVLKKYYRNLDKIFNRINKHKNLIELLEQPLTNKKFFRVN